MLGRGPRRDIMFAARTRLSSSLLTTPSAADVAAEGAASSAAGGSSAAAASSADATGDADGSSDEDEEVAVGFVGSCEGCLLVTATATSLLLHGQEAGWKFAVVELPNPRLGLYYGLKNGRIFFAPVPDVLARMLAAGVTGSAGSSSLGGNYGSEYFLQVGSAGHRAVLHANIDGLFRLRGLLAQNPGISLMTGNMLGLTQAQAASASGLELADVQAAAAAAAAPTTAAAAAAAAAGGGLPALPGIKSRVIRGKCHSWFGGRMYSRPWRVGLVLCSKYKDDHDAMSRELVVAFDDQPLIAVTHNQACSLRLSSHLLKTRKPQVEQLCRLLAVASATSAATGSSASAELLICLPASMSLTNVLDSVSCSVLAVIPGWRIRTASAVR